jgi:hypothetical protein
LTILYCSTDRLCRRGAAMKNLSHSASLQPKDKIAPSNAGTKHLRAFSSESCPALDAGWIPVRVKKMSNRKSGRYGCVAGMYLSDEGV